MLPSVKLNKNRKSVHSLKKRYDENKLKLNERDKEGNNCLHLAVIEQNIEIIKELSDLGVDINEKNKAGDTPLHLAVQVGSIEVITELLKIEKIKLDQKDKNGKTPLELAIKLKSEGEKYIKIAEKLSDFKVSTQHEETKSKVNDPDSLAFPTNSQAQALLAELDVKGIFKSIVNALLVNLGESNAHNEASFPMSADFSRSLEVDYTRIIAADFIPFIADIIKQDHPVLEGVAPNLEKMIQLIQEKADILLDKLYPLLFNKNGDFLPGFKTLYQPFKAPYEIHYPDERQVKFLWLNALFNWLGSALMGLQKIYPEQMFPWVLAYEMSIPKLSYADYAETNKEGTKDFTLGSLKKALREGKQLQDFYQKKLEIILEERRTDSPVVSESILIDEFKTVTDAFLGLPLNKKQNKEKIVAPLLEIILVLARVYNPGKFYPYARKLLQETCSQLLREIVVAAKKQDEEKIIKLQEIKDRIEKVFELKGSDEDLKTIFMALDIQVLTNEARSKRNAYQFELLRLGQKNVLNQQEILKEQRKNAFITGLKQNYKKDYYKGNSADFPKYYWRKSVFYFASSEQMISYYQNVLKQAMTKEESENIDFKVLTEPGKTIISIVQKTQEMSLQQPTELKPVVYHEIASISFTTKTLEQQGIEVISTELQGLKRIALAYKLFQNPLAALFSEIAIDNLKSFCSSVINHKGTNDHEAVFSAEILSYAGFIYAALQGIHDLDSEEFKNKLANQFQRILKKHEWTRDELLLCTKITSLVLGVIEGNSLFELNDLNDKQLQFLLKYTIHQAGFFDKAFEKAPVKLSEFPDIEQLPESIINKLVTGSRQLNNLIGIISNYCKAKAEKGSRPDKLIFLIENIIVKGILSQGEQPEDLYGHLLTLSHRFSVVRYFKDNVKPDDLNKVLTDFGQSQFAKDMQDVRAYRAGFSNPLLEKSLEYILKSLYQEIKKINEDYPAKAQCLQIIEKLSLSVAKADAAEINKLIREGKAAFNQALLSSRPGILRERSGSFSLIQQPSNNLPESDSFRRRSSSAGENPRTALVFGEKNTADTSATPNPK